MAQKIFKKVPFYKRKYLINRAFQIPFTIRLILVNLSVISISYALNYYLLFRFNYLAEEMGLPVDHYFYKFIRSELAHMSLIFLGFFAITVAVISIYSLFLSHRIVGPLENIKNCFKNIEDDFNAHEKANFKGTSFREDDFFKEFAKAYNDHMQVIQSKLKDKQMGEHTLKLVQEDLSENQNDKEKSKKAA
ncbi:hypothetical protein N9N67_01390 [Bacteriovoracaceae bacterium]|nr:hypothetical protein [Bacteriovoracaceae bacterium]